MFKFLKFFGDCLELLCKCGARVTNVGVVYFGAISSKEIDTFRLLVSMGKLTGRVNIQVVFIWFGVGSNGLFMLNDEVCWWQHERLGDSLIVKGLILG